ncbi:response regulator [Sphingomonas sp. Leaf339]|uniref:sigma-54-dependent transcriptional regulator n=1 Tax=Sphingomonas sp. Leaf339 TaxID=1736343 RepID=UPI0006F8C3FD|nr:response regulator [Sphingomonas sp. Leaf339]KQU61605.1 response regulator [Sphingomonas sp. Leaf339]
MSTQSPQVLVIDDDPDIVKAAALLLNRHGIAVTGAGDPDVAWVKLAERRFDAILLDLNFARGRTSGDEGFAMLERLIAADGDAVVVVVTGHSGIAVAVRAMREGASDFVIKPWSNERLLATTQRAIDLARAKRAVAPAPVGGDGGLLLGEDPSIVRIRNLVAQVAPTDAAALIRGPAGSGKSLVARALLAAARRGGPVVTVDGGGTIPDLPADGTLVIEDVDAIPRAAQAEWARGFGTTRIIATSRLDRAALRAVLIDDLLYRINTIEIDLPPLRDRGDDAVRLARHFLDLFAARYARPAKPIGDEAARAIAADRWPDDVRGLRQACERAVLLGTGAFHEIADFALSVDIDDPVPRAIADLNLARGEKAMVAAALQRHAFNVSRAAAELGLTRAALYRRMDKHGL